MSPGAFNNLSCTGIFSLCQADDERGAGSEFSHKVGMRELLWLCPHPRFTNPITRAFITLFWTQAARAAPLTSTVLSESDRARTGNEKNTGTLPRPPATLSLQGEGLRVRVKCS